LIDRSSDNRECANADTGVHKDEDADAKQKRRGNQLVNVPYDRFLDIAAVGA
jgi:hypothetical protein